MSSTVQFNLIPDSKYGQVKSDKQRKTLLRLAFLTAAALAGIFVLLLLTTQVVQKKQLSDAQGNIQEANNKLQAVPNIEQEITVQNQLLTLPRLHSAKHITSRLGSYLTQVTPADVKIGRVVLDLSRNTMIIGGTAKSQHSVNVFIDTLKFTTYSIDGQDSKAAFPSVVENTFSVTNNAATYELAVQIDPTLFSNNLVDSNGLHISPTLTVPKLTTTRSAIDDANNSLFNGQFNRKSNQR